MNAGNIFITGMHRAGTSWLSNVLGVDGEYIIKDEEIFRPTIPMQATPIKSWYLLIDKSNQNKYKAFIDGIVENNYNYFSSIEKIKTFRQFISVSKYKSISMYRKIILKNNPKIFVEPIGLLSSPWFVKKYCSKCIVMIRHPAAIISSMKRLNWSFDFNSISSQKHLIDKYFTDFANEILKPPNLNDIIKQGILLWKILHSVIATYEKQYPNWIFIRYEDLAINPISGYRNLFAQLNLVFNQNIKNQINKLSSSKNPIELPIGKRDTNKRNSAVAMHNWKTRLTQEEIQLIRAGVGPISEQWYSDKDWK